MVKENYNNANGHRAILTWLRDEGYDTTLPNVVEVRAECAAKMSSPNYHGLKLQSAQHKGHCWQSCEPCPEDSKEGSDSAHHR